MAKTYTAHGDIPKFSLVSFTANEKEVELAASGTSQIIGVSLDVDVTNGNLIDIEHDGVIRVRAGGTIKQGEDFTAKNGAVVKAASGDNIAGFALESANEGEYFLAALNIHHEISTTEEGA